MKMEADLNCRSQSGARRINQFIAGPLAPGQAENDVFVTNSVYIHGWPAWPGWRCFIGAMVGRGQSFGCGAFTPPHPPSVRQCSLKKTEPEGL
jgi:hypothetical protein